MLDGNIWQKQTNLGPDPAKPWMLGEALPGCRMLPCCTVDLTDLGPSFGSQRCQKSRVAISESVLPEPYLSTARGQDTHALVHTSPYPISPQLPLYFRAFLLAPPLWHQPYLIGQKAPSCTIPKDVLGLSGPRKLFPASAVNYLQTYTFLFSISRSGGFLLAPEQAHEPSPAPARKLWHGFWWEQNQSIPACCRPWGWGPVLSVHSLQKPSCPNGAPVTQSQEDFPCNTLVQCSLSAIIMLYKKTDETWLGYLNHALKWHEQGHLSLGNASAEGGWSGYVDTWLSPVAFLTLL